MPVPQGPPPQVVLAPLDSTLDDRQEQWSSMGIDTYQYRFRWECYCLDSYVRVVDINVRGGVVVAVRDAQTGQDLGPEAIAQYRTIDGLFDFVREARDLPASSILIGYHTGFGYPEAARVDYVGPAIDDEMAFHVYSLSPSTTR